MTFSTSTMSSLLIFMNMNFFWVSPEMSDSASRLILYTLGWVSAEGVTKMRRSFVSSPLSLMRVVSCVIQGLGSSMVNCMSSGIPLSTLMSICLELPMATFMVSSGTVTMNAKEGALSSNIAMTKKAYFVLTSNNLIILFCASLYKHYERDFRVIWKK